MSLFRITHQQVTEGLTDIKKSRESNFGRFVGSGMKSKGIFSREGFTSGITDQPLVQKRAGEFADAIGSGSANLQVLDDAGKPVTTRTLFNLNGRMHFTDKAGKIRLVDESVLQIARQKRQEVEEYIDSLISYASCDDWSLAQLLGMSDAATKKLCQPNGAKVLLADYGLNVVDEVDAVNCLPSVMRYYAPNSMQEGMAITKLRMILEAFAPIVDNLGTKKALNDEDAMV